MYSGGSGSPPFKQKSKSKIAVVAGGLGDARSSQQPTLAPPILASAAAPGDAEVAHTVGPGKCDTREARLGADVGAGVGASSSPVGSRPPPMEMDKLSGRQLDLAA